MRFTFDCWGFGQRHGHDEICLDVYYAVEVRSCDAFCMNLCGKMVNWSPRGPSSNRSAEVQLRPIGLGHSAWLLEPKEGGRCDRCGWMIKQVGPENQGKP